MQNDINNRQNKQSVEQLIEENLKLTRELSESVAKINKWIFWQKVKGIITIMLIVIPIILGFIYLPPVVSEFYENYKSLFAPVDLSV